MQSHTHTHSEDSKDINKSIAYTIHSAYVNLHTIHIHLFIQFFFLQFWFVDDKKCPAFLLVEMNDNDDDRIESKQQIIIFRCCCCC